MSRKTQSKQRAAKRRKRERRLRDLTAERVRHHARVRRESTAEELEQEAARQAEAERREKREQEARERDERRRLDAEIDPAKRWHIVEAKPGQTARMVASLRKAKVPVFRPDEQREIILPDGRRRVVREPLLSRDVFVGLDRPTYTDELEREHWQVGRVANQVGELQHRPVIVQAAELQAFSARVIGLVDPDGPCGFEVGDQVRVTKGPFASFVGPIEEQVPDTDRWKVGVNIFGRSTPVELSEAEFERA